MMDEFRVTISLAPKVLAPREQTKLAAVLSRLPWSPTVDANRVSFVLPAKDRDEAKYILAASMHDRLAHEHHWLKYQPTTAVALPPYSEDGPPGTHRGECIGSYRCRCSACRSAAERDARDDDREYPNEEGGE